MFDQTFVDGTQKTKKPFTVLLSLLLQIGRDRHLDSDSFDLYTDAAQCSVEEHVGSAATTAASAATTASAREGGESGEAGDQAVLSQPVDGAASHPEDDRPH